MRMAPKLGPFVTLVAALLLALAPIVLLGARVSAQSASPVPCEPLARPTPPTATPDATSAPAAMVPDGATSLKVGFVPVSIYAPVFVAAEKGYFAEEGLAVELEPLPGGADLVALTAAGQLQAAAAGAGPAFWNAVALGLPVVVVAPGHFEGSPVATPLMISRAACESEAITSVADLRGKRVSVNARGATEYWLAQALATGGLTIDDIDLQTIPFPDAVVALEAGAIDAAMVGEPLATKAELDGIAIRLAADFPVQDVMPTAIMANADWAAANPEAMTGFVRGYLRAAAELDDGGFQDPEIHSIIEEYTGVPAELIAAAVPPLYAPDGAIDPAALGTLQAFFRERGQLEYPEDIEPVTVIDRTFVDGATDGTAPSG